MKCQKPRLTLSCINLVFKLKFSIYYSTPHLFTIIARYDMDLALNLFLLFITISIILLMEI